MQSTHRTYNSGQQHYLRFCQHTGLQPIPASEHQLMLFAAYLALKGLRWQTIKTYLSVVRHFHLLSGFPDSAHPRLQLKLRGIKKATSTMPTKVCLPITPTNPPTGVAGTSPIPSHRRFYDALGCNDHLLLWVPPGRRSVHPYLNLLRSIVASQYYRHSN